MGQQRRIEVDGEEWWWSSRTSRTKTNDEPWRDCVVMTIAKVGFESDSCGVILPAGTGVTEARAAEAVRSIRAAQESND